MAETKQLALNPSGYRQLPLLTDDQARDEFRRLSDLNAVPPVRAPFVAKSPTSKAAAAALTPEQLSHQGRLVLDYLRQRGDAGATDPEIFAAVPLREASARRARVVLMDRGYVVDSGQRRVNPGSGKACVVWTAADQQRQAPDAAA